MNVRKLPNGDLYVLLSGQDEKEKFRITHPAGSGVFSDSVFFVSPGDADYEEYLKDAVPVRVISE